MKITVEPPDSTKRFSEIEYGRAFVRAGSGYPIYIKIMRDNGGQLCPPNCLVFYSCYGHGNSAYMESDALVAPVDIVSLQVEVA